MAEPDDGAPTKKLNILALPSYTAILFALIALVVLGAALASVLPGAQLWWPPIVVGLTLLPLRDFWHRPDRFMRARGLKRRDDAETQALDAETARLGAALSTPARVVIAEAPHRAFAFGTFRRRHIALGRGLASAIAANLTNSDATRRDIFRMILAHEVSHFLNRDVSLVWLSYGLLKLMMLVALVNLWVTFGLALFIIEVGPEVARPEFWGNLTQFLANTVPGVSVPDLTVIFAWLQRQNPAIVARLADPAQQTSNWLPFFYYATASHLPFFLSGAVLATFFWRRLVRVREFYADARAVELIGDAALVRKAIATHTILASLSAQRPSLWGQMRAWLAALSQRLPLLGPQLAMDPGRKAREACLLAPEQAFGGWRSIAVSVALAVVLLDLLLRGTLTAAHITEPGAHLPFLAAFLVLGLWALPQVALGERTRRTLRRELVYAVLLFTGIKLLPHLLDLAFALVTMVFNPTQGGWVLDLWAHSMTGGLLSNMQTIMGVEVSWPDFISMHMLRPIAYFALLMPPALIGFLFADVALKRRALTWYRLGRRVRRVFWSVSGVLAALLVFVVVPILNHLVFPWIYPSWSTAALVGATVALALAFGGGGVFYWYDRRLGRRCAGCGAVLTEDYYPGQRCSCEHEQHAWLARG